MTRITHQRRMQAIRAAVLATTPAADWSTFGPQMNYLVGCAAGRNPLPNCPCCGPWSVQALADVRTYLDTPVDQWDAVINPPLPEPPQHFVSLVMEAAHG